METLLIQPLIIQKIFNHLSPPDIFQCRLVCKAWHEVAVRVLQECPAFEVCSSAVRVARNNSVMPDFSFSLVGMCYLSKLSCTTIE